MSRYSHPRGGRSPTKRAPADEPRRFDSVQSLEWQLKLGGVRVVEELPLTEFAKLVAIEMRRLLEERPFPSGCSVAPGLYRAFITTKATLTKWQETAESAKEDRHG